MVELNVLKDNSEIVPYNFAHFPVHSTLCRLSIYPNMTAASHWHMDLEFITVLKGHLLYCVNGIDYPLKEGQCMIINSKQLHHPRSLDGSDCLFCCQLFHPSLLGANEAVYQTYIQPICQNSALSSLVLSPEEEWQASVIAKLKHIFTICETKEAGIELDIMSQFYSLWLIIYRNIKPHAEPAADKRLETLSRMIGHVQKHYPEKITLHDIAGAGRVCRSSCCSIFSELLQMSPIQYLTNYRLEKSIEMLHHSALSITEIAMLNGFNSSSYFTEIFHRKLGCTPSVYLSKLNGAV